MLVLVDGEIGPTKLDVTMLEWPGATSLPFTVVATKHDKVSRRSARSARPTSPRAVGSPKSEIVWVSAAKGVGIESFQGLVRAWLARGPA